MQSMQKKFLTIPFLVAAAIGTASAQTDGSTPGWRPFGSLTLWGQGDTDVDDGGSFRASGASLRAGVGGVMGSGHQASVTLTYDLIDYRFSAPAAFGNAAPWDDVQRLGVGAQFVFRGANGWSYLVSPSVGYSMEDDAKSDDALVYGAFAAAVKRFGAERTIGLGLGVFDQIEKAGWSSATAPTATGRSAPAPPIARCASGCARTGRSPTASARNAARSASCVPAVASAATPGWTFTPAPSSPASSRSRMRTATSCSSATSTRPRCWARRCRCGSSSL